MTDGRSVADCGFGEAAGEALLRVAEGNPTDDELAALVAVLAARRATAAVVDPATGQRRRLGWADRARGVRGRHLPGPGGWRAVAAPR